MISFLIHSSLSFRLLEANCSTFQNVCIPTGNSTQIEEEPLDVLKITVLSVIIVLTFLGNVAIIVAIAARGSKLTRQGDQIKIVKIGQNIFENHHLLNNS